MLLSLFNFIIGPPDNPKKALITADYNEDTNIMSIDVSTTNEEISLALANRMFESLSEYYVNKAIEKQAKTLSVITAKKDSHGSDFRTAAPAGDHRAVRYVC